MSKKKRTSRRRHSVTPRALVRNARGALRRLAKNMTVGGIDTIDKIVVPAVGATGGLLLSQWLGSKVAASYMPGYDPRLVALGTAAATALGAYKLGTGLGLAPDTQMVVAAGAGIAGLLPWVPPAMLPMVSSAAAPPPNVATSGFYQRGMLSGLMVDVSHAGAPYKGMLGLGADPADQSVIDDVLTTAEGGAQAVSMVEPRDMALPVTSKRAFRRVRETMATPRDRGWAGGLYARTLFSGATS